MQKVIGLDIGSYSLKAIEIINTFKSYEITNFYETVIPPLSEVPPDVILPICMEQLFNENKLEADRIIAAMPGQFISSRILSFNYSDPRKIETSVQGELEDAVPFNLDDMIIDHQILGASGKKTLTLAVMTRKAFLKNFLDLLGRVHIDPKLVDIDSLAFYNLNTYTDGVGDKSFAIIDIGHEKTSICIVQNDLLRMFRSINLGGRYITDFLARDLQVTFSEAQRIKHKMGRVLCSSEEQFELSEEEKLIAERVTLAANAIVKELGRTFYAYKNWDKDPIGKIFISGGTSKIRGLDHFLTQHLEIPTVHLKLDRHDLKINPDVIKSIQVVPQSLAIGLRAVTNLRKHSQINLRKGEFAYVQNYENLLKGASSIFKVITMALSLLIISYLFKFYFYTKEISELKEQYRKEFLSSFPDQKSK
ncbi:MAG: pilus assembly protein PilM [Oligoflexales bacterium]|nr:pilus assembly protein PilM [Oligoflexales bacterium]